MARKSLFEGWSVEELIIAYALNFCNETKKARKQEQEVLKELANRGVIDLDKMKELYEKKAL